MKIYRITPLEKKNVSVNYDVYEELADGNVRGWRVDETYRWGLGYRPEDDPVSEWESKNNGISCDLSVGDGAELDDLIACYFEFDEAFTDEEKQEIENNWEEGGAAWLYDGEHDWQVDCDSLIIYGPVKIDLIDNNTGEVLEEDIKPNTETANLSWKTVSDGEVAVWPFPINDTFGETDKTS